MTTTLIDLDDSLLYLIFFKLRFSSARDYRSLAETCKRFGPLLKPGIHRRLKRWDVFKASVGNELDMLAWLKSHKVYYLSESVIGAIYARDFTRAFKTLKRIKAERECDEILETSLQKKVPDKIIAYLLQTNIRSRRLDRAALRTRYSIWKIVPGHISTIPKKDRRSLKTLGVEYVKREYPNFDDEMIARVIKEWEDSGANGIRNDLDVIARKVMDGQ